MKKAEKRLRQELKYYIHPHEYRGLRARLQEVLTMDRFSVNEDGYQIRSLYFDDAYDTALHEKTAGVRMRDKYRVRIYNGSDQVIKLERKSKYGSVVAKSALSITRPKFEDMLVGNYRFLKDYRHELAEDFYLKANTRGLQPRVIVDYQREAYVYKHGDVRVTFDKELKVGVNSYDLFNPDLIQVETVQAPKLIMEVKYTQFLPSYIHSLLQLDTHQRSAISKYVICRENGFNYYLP